MKKLAWIILACMLCLSCAKQEELYCRVTLEAEASFPIVAISVDNSLSGNYFRNLNTGESYEIPVFVNGQCELTVLRGVYILAFDGVAAGADGRAVRVRSAQHATAPNAVSLDGNEATVTLQLLELP